MKYVNRQNNEPSTAQPRRLKTKPLLALVGILVLSNLIWFIAWLLPSKSSPNNEEVASVNGVSIIKETWMAAMEEKIGRETLQELINNEVMKAVAKDYGIKVSKKEIDLELALIRSVDQGFYIGLDETKEREAIESKLILEKVLTKDVLVNKKEIKKHYEENVAQYQIEDAYRTSLIVVPTLADGERALQELKEGSNFNTLAKELSIDLTSANLGGDIGFINHSVDSVDERIVQAASNLKKDTVSELIPLDDGTYAIIQVTDEQKGKNFKLKEVSAHIERELAMRQLTEIVTPETFWKDFNVKWFYGK